MREQELFSGQDSKAGADEGAGQAGGLWWQVARDSAGWVLLLALLMLLPGAMGRVLQMVGGVV